MSRGGEGPRSCRRHLLGGEPFKTFAVEEPHPFLYAVGEDDARHAGKGSPRAANGVASTGTPL